MTVLQIANTKAVVISPTCEYEESNITLTYNSFSVTYPFSFIINITFAGKISSISPASASPVLKSIMTIQGSGFGTNLTAVSVYLSNDTGKVYTFRVLSVNDTTITCGIPGGIAGTY